MEYSPKQDQALCAVREWLERRDKPWFYLAGYAGTGKTTLAKHFAEGVGGGVCFGAFTGKAAYVLQQKGCPGATTIHRLIYKPKDKSTQRLRELEETLEELKHEHRQEMHQEYGGEPYDKQEVEDRLNQIPKVKELKVKIEEERVNLRRPMFHLNLDSEVRNARLLVIDECSMVDQQMGEDLLSFDVPVLVLGDPAQLPPVRGAGFFTGGKPDFLLTEIHRQARDNPILRLATEVREGRALEEGDYGDSVVMDLRDAHEELYCSHDQMLVGKNATRRGCNRKIRTLRGREDALPTPGDRLVCLRNNHEVGLLNGGLWEVQDAVVIDGDEIGLTVKSEDGAQSLTTVAHTAYFLGKEPPYWEIKERDCFDYGYALTTHKAQGSQWDSVLVFDESFFFRDDASKWLYTAITRAAKRVTVVKR